MANINKSELPREQIEKAMGCKTVEALMALADKGPRHFILGHMSQENNTPNLALLTSETRAELDGLENGRDLWIDRAWRDRVGNLYRLNPTGVLAHA